MSTKKVLTSTGSLFFVYRTELVQHPLDCSLDYEAAERGDSESPGYPASYSLQEVLLRGVNIMGLISEGLIDEIEEAAYEYFESGQAQVDDYEPPDDYDGYAPV